MADVVDFNALLRTQAESDADFEARIHRAGQRQLILAKAMEEMRQNGSSAEEIAHTLRHAVDGLEGRE